MHKLKVEKKVHEICENRAGISQSHHFHKIGIGISLSMEASDAKTLVVGLELLSQALCHSSTFWNSFTAQIFVTSAYF